MRKTIQTLTLKFTALLNSLEFVPITVSLYLFTTKLKSYFKLYKCIINILIPAKNSIQGKHKGWLEKFPLFTSWRFPLSIDLFEYAFISIMSYKDGKTFLFMQKEILCCSQTWMEIHSFCDVFYLFANLLLLHMSFSEWSKDKKEKCSCNKMRMKKFFFLILNFNISKGIEQKQDAYNVISWLKHESEKTALIFYFSWHEKF